jgi:precorrin-4 C11-methyltransferase
MTLDEILDVIVEAHEAGQDVARVHTGDPSIFGSTAEQMRRMKALGIPYEIIPGVSSFTAAAAAVGRELTLPELSQTVILSRAEGRTPVPDREKLAELGRHQATLALFLSVTLLEEMARDLIPSYGADCPVAVVHKASCPDQKIVWATLADVAAKVRAAGIRTQSMVLVGRVLTAEDFANSRLYDPDFSHRFRRAGKGPIRRPPPKTGVVYLVGAGPGDPDLLTVRARELLRTADVVAHDALISSSILQLVGPTTELLPVGRRHGAGTVSYRLHPEVLARAGRGARVVRLKTGDPFLFGRGGEEAEELREAGIAYEIVPGISAALGAAACAGIPLTHREWASEVTFLTGHDASWETAGTGTVVLFMAARKLIANLARLIEKGRSPDTPAAYIASASLPDQAIVVGTLGTLADKTRGLDPSAPALVIVGEVVRLRERIALRSAS